MQLAAPRLCFDTNALIYLLDRVTPYHAWLDQLFLSIYSGERIALFSVVSEAEILVGPIRQGRHDKLDRINAFFAHRFVTLMEVSREIAHSAARIRAELNLKLPDSIIVATAIAAECDALVGNDGRCAGRVKAIPYIYLEDAIANGRVL